MKIQRNVEGVVQWKGDNILEVKNFCKPYTNDLTFCNNFLFIRGVEVKINEIIYIDEENFEIDILSIMSEDYFNRFYKKVE